VFRQRSGIVCKALESGDVCRQRSGIAGLAFVGDAALGPGQRSGIAGLAFAGDAALEAGQCSGIVWEALGPGQCSGIVCEAFVDDDEFFYHRGHRRHCYC